MQPDALPDQLMSGGRQRRSAVRYTNVAQASASPILSKANKQVDFHLPEVAMSAAPAVALLASVASMQGWRKDNEDRHALVAFDDPAGGFEVSSAPKQSVALGVFDGHRGSAAAAYCAEHLVTEAIAPHVAAAESSLRLEDVERSFQSVDDNLRKHLADLQAATAAAGGVADSSPSPSPLVSPRASAISPTAAQRLSLMIGSPPPAASAASCSGTTAVVAVLRREEVVVFNVGDSRAYLVQQRLPSNAEVAAELRLRAEQAAQLAADGGTDAGGAAPILPAGMTVTALSSDHRTTRDDECRRIIAAGGFVVNGRVNGKLSVTRALGDFELKATSGAEQAGAHGPLSGVVICLPEVRQAATSISIDSAGASSSHPPCDLEFTAVLVGCDGVWELQSAERIAVRLREKLLHEASGPSPGQEGPEAAATPNLPALVRHQAALKAAIVETLHAGCAAFGDPTGKTPGSDNMSLGIILAVSATA